MHLTISQTSDTPPSTIPNGSARDAHRLKRKIH